MEDRQLGGVGFLIANAAMFANGLIAHLHANTPESRKAGVGRMAASGLWTANASFLAVYGAQPVEKQQARVDAKLAAYLQSQGVPLGVVELKKAGAETRQGVVTHLEDFFYAHPIECGNAYYAVASTGYAVSGRLRQKDGNRQAGNANIGVTALSMTGALASILIPEKTPEQVEAKGQKGTLWGNVQEHPLGYVRWLFLGVDALAGLEALAEYRAAKKLPVGNRYRPWQFTMAGLSVVAMSTAMVSDWLTSGSKKANGSAQEHHAAQMAIEQVAAQHIAALPEDQQTLLAQATARYLVTQHELRFSDRNPEQLAMEILEKIHAKAAVETKPVLGAHTQRSQWPTENSSLQR